MKLVREIRVRDLFVYFWLQIPVIAAIWTAFGLLVAYSAIPLPTWATALIAAALTYVPLRLLAIGCILMYKAYAPMSVRNECRFTPTCSTYMLTAIKKYGLIIGIIKGVRRICRCKPPNGGEDWP